MHHVLVVEESYLWTINIAFEFTDSGRDQRRSPLGVPAVLHRDARLSVLYFLLSELSRNISIDT